MFILHRTIKYMYISRVFQMPDMKLHVLEGGF